MTFCFGNPGESKTQGKQALGQGSSWCAYSSCCACLALKPAGHFHVLFAVSAGCTLFFYETDGRSGIDHNSIPKHAVWVENSIVQAVPEHPKKDFVFCLSNSLGDAFLFQVGFCKAFFCLPARRASSRFGVFLWQQ